MKNFLVFFMVLAAMTSCGKNNAITGASSIGNGTSAITTSGTDMSGRVPLSTYMSNVNNNGFNPAVADSEYYRFYNSAPGAASNNGCTLHTALGGFLSYYSCTGSYGTSTATGTYDMVTVVHSTQDLSAKKTELINIIGQANQWGNSYDKLRLYVKTVSGDVYTIDFRVPMAANPVVKYTASTGITRSFDYSTSGYGSLSQY